MKVRQAEPVPQPPPFKPVVITLETQAEVDALFGIFNFTPITNVAVNNGVNLFSHLLEFKTGDCKKAWREVRDEFSNLKYK